MNKKKVLIHSVKHSKIAKQTGDSYTYNRIQATAGSGTCPYCPRWEGDNMVKRNSGKRGPRKPRKNDKIHHVPWK